MQKNVGQFAEVESMLGKQAQSTLDLTVYTEMAVSRPQSMPLL